MNPQSTLRKTNEYSLDHTHSLCTLKLKLDEEIMILLSNVNKLYFPKYLITYRPGRPQSYKTFFVLNSTEHKFIMLMLKCQRLLAFKMLTIVDILTFISMINTTSERLKARNFFICRYFKLYEQLKFCAQLS